MLPSALAGVALTGAYAPLSWFPLAVLAPAAALIVWRRLPPRHAFWNGWVFGLACFGTSFYWAFNSLHDFGEAPAALAAAGTFLAVAGLAAYCAGLAWAVAYAARRLSVIWLCLFAYPSLWLLSEWLRGLPPIGFPWNSVGQALMSSPFTGVLPIIGASGASWLTVFLAGCLVAAFSKRTSIRAGVIILVVAIAVPALAFTTARFEWTVPDGDGIDVALVQGNIEQSLKFDRDNLHHVIRSYRRLTADAIGADLVLWPETAVPVYYDLLEEDLVAPLGKEIRAAGGEFVLGAFARDDSGVAYNAIVRAAHPPRIYHKRHLVPFGEYLPLRDLLRFFRSWILIPMSDLGEGEGRPLMRIGAHDVGVSICYEVSFASEMMEALPDAAYLINISNDSWFGDSLAPHQHLQISRLRAAETGRAMVRATSTGISAIIDHTGGIVARSQQFTEQVLTGTVVPRRGRTPYSIWGDAPVLAWSLLWLALAIGAGARKRNG